MNLYSVIKNDAPKEEKFAIWKFCGEDFKNGSQLIVNESEEAIFIKDGLVENIFSAGKYTLSTNNYPFITAFRSFASGGVSAFNCKIYFVDKSHFLDTKWGTNTPIQVRDPVMGIAVSIQARGSYTLKVSDSKKFYLKFVGGGCDFVTQADILQQRRSPILQSIKTIIPTAIKEANVEILGISSQQEKFAEMMTAKISVALEDYGLEVVDFYVEALDIPMDDPNRIKLENAVSDKAVMGVLGEDWTRQKSVEILGSLSENQGAGGIAAMGAGLGMGMAAGGAFGTMSQNVFAQQQTAPENRSAVPNQMPPNNAQKSSAMYCSSCGAMIPKEAKFCPSCGVKVPVAEKICSCGQALSNGEKFCPSCGKPTKF